MHVMLQNICFEREAPTKKATCQGSCSFTQHYRQREREGERESNIVTVIFTTKLIHHKIHPRKKQHTTHKNTTGYHSECNKIAAKKQTTCSKKIRNLKNCYCQYVHLLPKGIIKKRNPKMLHALNHPSTLVIPLPHTYAFSKRNTILHFHPSRKKTPGGGVTI